MSKEFMYLPRFSDGDSRYFWMKQCFGFFSQLVGDEPPDLRMRVPPPTTNFDGKMKIKNDLHNTSKLDRLLSNGHY
jgi:hypothetical protein